MSAIIAMVLLAQAIDPDLSAAEKAFERGEYDAVLPRLDAAMAHPLPLEQLERAMALQAQTQAAFGHADQATEAFRRLLGIDPSYLPAPDASPKLLAVFSEARRRGPIAPPPGLLPAPKKVELVPLPKEPPPPVVEPDRPLTSRWWFWTAIGVVVVGAAAAGTVAYVQRPVTPSGSLGTGNLQ